MASGFGVALPVFLQPGHVAAAVQVVAHRAGAAVARPVDRHGGLAEANRVGGGVHFHAGGQVEQVVDVAVHQRQLDDLTCSARSGRSGRRPRSPGARPQVTVTVSVSVPSSSTASTRAFRFTSSTMPDCTYFLKPWREASRVYEPNGSALKEYSPLASALAERVKFVSMLNDPYVGFRHDRAGAVLDRAEDSGGGDLRGQSRGDQQKCDCQENHIWNSHIHSSQTGNVETRGGAATLPGIRSLFLN